MCGIAGIFGDNWKSDDVSAMTASQRHRGPDGEGLYLDPEGTAGLGHNRLSIIDLSESGRQPMTSRHGHHIIVLNGEIYNYMELRRELMGSYEFKTSSDTEVLLAAFEKWGKDCLGHLIGMFAFIVWNEKEKTAFAARDRFGVKPLYYHKKDDGTLFISSEIKALHAAGVSKIPNLVSWATYLTNGLYDHSEHTFWNGVHSLPGGHYLTWRHDQFRIAKWYDMRDSVGDEHDQRPEKDVETEYFDLMKESVKLRFRSDVPVGINLSGGLDSSCLLGLVHEVQGRDSDVKVFSFATGDKNYDETPWVEQMLARTNHQLIVSSLEPREVPALAESVQYHQDEPFGGIPTLAYAKLFQTARDEGSTVLLDGNGMDEQWAGYDYYQDVLSGPTSTIQGTKGSTVRPECLVPDFRRLATTSVSTNGFADSVRSLQYRDLRFTKLPRALRFNDRISMRASTELREPFLDHRLFELAFRQSTDRKIQKGTGKRMLRDIARDLLPSKIAEAPKRPIQTPQREWLRGSLRDWADGLIETALNDVGGDWLDVEAVRSEWAQYCRGVSDNSFFIWQWISLGMESKKETAAVA